MFMPSHNLKYPGCVSFSRQNSGPINLAKNPHVTILTLFMHKTLLLYTLFRQISGFLMKCNRKFYDLVTHNILKPNIRPAR